MKIKRQYKIIEIIKNHDVETQEELAERLKGVGYDVTQATVSRDIKELKLTKVQTVNGRQKYAVLTNSDTEFLEKHYRIFSDAVIALNYTTSLIVIKTLNGMAMAVAAAIDGMDYKEIMGTIAGDDTLFCAVESEENAIAVIGKFNNIINKMN